MSKLEKACSVPDCKVNTFTHPNLLFHSLPDDPDCREKWLEFIGKSSDPQTPYYVCSFHFEEKDFDLSPAPGTTFLKENAVPSVLASTILAGRMSLIKHTSSKNKTPEPSQSTSNAQPTSDDDDVIFLGAPPQPPELTRNKEHRLTPAVRSARSKVNILQRRTKPKTEQDKTSAASSTTIDPELVDACLISDHVYFSPSGVQPGIPSARSKVNILQRRTKTKTEDDETSAAPGATIKPELVDASLIPDHVYFSPSGVQPGIGGSPVPMQSQQYHPTSIEKLLTCCASNCRSQPISGCKMMFFTFPHDADLREKWIKAMRTDNPHFTVAPHNFLCELHFTSNDFARVGRSKVLKGGVVPSVFIEPSGNVRVECCIAGCPSKMDGKTPVSFHRFPLDDGMRKLWIRAANLKFLPGENAFVCSSHFLPDFITKSNRGVVNLLKNAVPTIFPDHIVYLKPPSPSDPTPLKMEVLKKVSPLENGCPLRLKIPRVSLKLEDRKRADEVLKKMSKEEYNELQSTIPAEERQASLKTPGHKPSANEAQLKWKGLEQRLRLRLEACSTDISGEPSKTAEGIPIIQLELPSLIPQMTTIQTSTDPSQPVKHLAIVPLSQLKGFPIVKGSLPARLPATPSSPAAKKLPPGPFRITKLPPSQQGESKAMPPTPASSSNDPDHTYSSMTDFGPPETIAPAPRPLKAEPKLVARLPLHHTLVKKGSDTDTDDSGEFSPSPPPSPARVGRVGPIVGIERIDYLRKIYKTKMDSYRRRIKLLMQSKRRMALRLQALSKKLDVAEMNLKAKTPVTNRKSLEQVIVLDTVQPCPCRRQKRLRMALMPPPREDLDSVLQGAVEQIVPDREESIEIVADNEKLLKRIVNIKQTLRNKEIVRCVMIEAEEIDSLPS